MPKPKQPEASQQPDQPTWGDVVRAGLQNRGITAHAAAIAVGVSPASLSSWLNGHAEPSLPDLKRLAAVAGLPYAYVLRLADRLPDELAGASALTLVETAVRRAVDELRQWTQAAQELVDVDASAMLAGAALEHCGGWQVLLRPRFRGERYRCRTATLVGLEPISVTESDPAREHLWLERVLGPAIDRAGATWCQEGEVDDWPGAPRHVLHIPALDRTRGPQHLSFVPAPAIGVVGLPGSGAEVAASVIANEYGLGLVNPADSVQRCFGLRRGHAERADGMRSIVDGLVTSGTAMARHVWVGDTTVIDPDLVRRAKAPVVVVQPGPRLRKNLERRSDLPPAEWSRSLSALEELAVAKNAVTLQLDDAAVLTRQQLDADRLFDATWALGLDAVSELRPAFESTRGR